MTDTFTWRVTAEASGGGQFTVSTSKFGDGYQQDTAIGLNNDVQKWTVTYVGYKTDARTVLDFIRAKMGSVAFFWTPPLGDQGYYKCKKYTPVNVGGLLYTLQFDFEQVFAP
jgi:phage-related protein